MRRAAAVTVIAVLSAPFTASEARSQFADSITVRHVAGHVYVLEGAVDLIGVSVGRDGLLMVDGGYMETEEMVRDALRSLEAGPPRILVNTHWHHFFANPAFAPEATIIAHRAVRERAARTNRMAGRAVPPQPPEGWPDLTFEDSLTLHFNGERIRLVHLPGAHTDSDVVVVFEGSNVVMTGDVFVPHLPWIDFEGGGDLDGLIRALDVLVDRVPPDATIIPGHERIADYGELVEFRDVIRGSVEFVASRMEEDRTLPEILEEGLPARWARWATMLPESLFVASIHRGVEERAAACRYVNGRWFDGEGFRERAFDVVGGRLRRAEGRPPGCVVDLEGGWVVPPYGEAHTHALADPDGLDEEIDSALTAGVFYAMNQDPIVELGPATLDRVNRPGSVEVAYARGVVTPSWGMITDYYRRMAEAGRFGPDAALADLDTRNLFIIDDRADLAAKWERLAAMNDRFIKVILAFSEEFDLRRGNPAYGAEGRSSAKPGIDPALLPEIVERAHASDLRVSVHIETAADVRRAAGAGADLIAHLPASWQIGEGTGYRDGSLDHWMLTEEDARAVSRHGTAIITTALTDPRDPRRDDFVEVHRHNLSVLARAGARLALGSDGAPDAILDEVEFIDRLGVFDRGTLLRLLTTETPRTIFPDRRIGRLREGYEASFLVLEGNPLESRESLRRIRLRVKEGRALDRE